MLTKLVDQCPKTSPNILLTWANMARISLQMWHGYSSYQLVFGTNPNLPNIMTDNLPALQGATSSEILTKHLQALHESRKLLFNLKQMNVSGEHYDIKSEQQSNFLTLMIVYFINVKDTING